MTRFRLWRCFWLWLWLRARTSALCVLLAAVALLASGCDPYLKYGKNGESLGPVDPVNFPQENMGEGGNHKASGDGSFTEIVAYVRGTRVGYFSYPVRVGAVETGDTPNETAYVPVPEAPKVYAFDATGMANCTPPPGYVFDARLDEVDLAQQGNVFTELPSASYREGVRSSSEYAPVVSQALVDLGGAPCQQIKSEDELLGAMGVAAAKDIPESGQLLAWLVIDPAAPVYAIGQSEENMDTGLGLQRWGWFNRYLLAYLDGGVLPTRPAPDMKSTQVQSQRIYIPNEVMGVDPKEPDTWSEGKTGEGYDVLQFRRNEPGYSPLCEVWQYNATKPDPTGGLVPVPLTPEELPKDEASVLALDPNPTPYQPTAVDELIGYDRRFIHCLQVSEPVAREGSQ